MRELRKYRQPIVRLTNKKIALPSKRRALVQKGSAIAAAILTIILSGVLSSLGSIIFSKRLIFLKVTLKNLFWTIYHKCKINSLEHPVLNSIMKIQDEIEEILIAPEKSDDEKVSLLKIAQARFNKLRGELGPVPVAALDGLPIPTPPQPPASPSPASSRCNPSCFQSGPASSTGTPKPPKRRLLSVKRVSIHMRR